MTLSLTARSAIAALAMLAGGGVAQADFWSDAGAPYKGTTIRGVSESTPPSNYVKDVLAPAFTKATGINVEFEATSWDQMYDKAIKDMEANTGIYDFVYIEQDIIYSYLSRDFLVDITQSLKDNPKLAAPDFKVEDFTSFIDYFKGAERRHLRRADGGLRQGLSLSKGSVRRSRRSRKPSRRSTAATLRRRRPTRNTRDIAEFFTQWGKDNGHGAVGHDGPGAFRPPGVLVRVLRESVAPTFGVYNWGINPEKNYAASVANGGSMNGARGQGGARILARHPRISRRRNRRRAPGTRSRRPSPPAAPLRASSMARTPPGSRPMPTSRKVVGNVGVTLPPLEPTA